MSNSRESLQFPSWLYKILKKTDKVGLPGVNLSEIGTGPWLFGLHLWPFWHLDLARIWLTSARGSPLVYPCLFFLHYIIPNRVHCIVSDLEKILLLFNFLHTLLLTSTLYSSSTSINFSNLVKLYSLILLLCFYFLLHTNIYIFYRISVQVFASSWCSLLKLAFGFVLLIIKLQEVSNFSTSKYYWYRWNFRIY